MELQQRLRAFLETVPLVDGHEHYFTSRQFRDLDQGSYVAAALLAYLRDDVLALGATPEQVFPAPTEAQAWDVYGPRLVALRNTGYYRAASLACRRFYACDLPATREAWMALSARIADRYQGETWFLDTIRDAMHCRLVSWAPLGVDDAGAENPYPALLRRNSQSLHTLHFDYPLNAAARAEYVQRSGVVGSLDELLADYRAYICTERDRGLVSLKNGDAYGMGLAFHPVQQADAERIFAAGCRGETLSLEDVRAWRNYFEFFRARVAAEWGLTFQVHTGILAVAHGQHDIRKTDPLLLHDLLSTNPDTTFELFHGGYPFTDHYTVMGRIYPNVVLNLCWLHQISPSGYERTLSEALDTVSYTKIIAFGGDTVSPEASWGALQLAKDGAAHVLAHKVSDGAFCEEVAYEILQAIFHDNGVRLWA